VKNKCIFSYLVYEVVVIVEQIKVLFQKSFLAKTKSRSCLFYGCGFWILWSVFVWSNYWVI